MLIEIGLALHCTSVYWLPATQSLHAACCLQIYGFISYLVIHKGKKIERKSISPAILIGFDSSRPRFVFCSTITSYPFFRPLQHITPLSLGEGNGGEAFGERGTGVRLHFATRLHAKLLTFAPRNII